MNVYLAYRTRWIGQKHEAKVAGCVVCGKLNLDRNDEYGPFCLNLAHHHHQAVHAPIDETAKLEVVITKPQTQGVGRAALV